MKHHMYNKSTDQVPKEPHWQVLVFEELSYHTPSYDYRYGYDTNCTTVIRLYTFLDESEWRDFINDLYKSKPNRTDVVAQKVEGVAQVQAKFVVDISP